MNMVLKFGIGADSSTFGLPPYATPRYQMGFFRMGLADNLGLYYVAIFWFWFEQGGNMSPQKLSFHIGNLSPCSEFSVS